MDWKRKTGGSVLASIGFLLSPLSRRYALLAIFSAGGI
jgi:hypothetical protein